MFFLNIFRSVNLFSNFNSANEFISEDKKLVNKRNLKTEKFNSNLNQSKFSSIIIPLFEIKTECNYKIPYKFIKYIDLNNFPIPIINLFSNTEDIKIKNFSFNFIKSSYLETELNNKYFFNIFLEEVDFFISKNPITNILSLYALLTLKNKDLFFKNKNNYLNIYSINEKNQLINNEYKIKNIEIIFDILKLKNKLIEFSIIKGKKKEIYNFIFPNFTNLFSFHLNPNILNFKLNRNEENENFYIKKTYSFLNIKSEINDNCFIKISNKKDNKKSSILENIIKKENKKKK